MLNLSHSGAPLVIYFLLLGVLVVLYQLLPELDECVDVQLDSLTVLDSHGEEVQQLLQYSHVLWRVLVLFDGL